MKTVDKPDTRERLSECLAMGGFRFTAHRRRVYQLLLRRTDHPSAEEVFLRVKRTLPEISMATVYNCLDALVECGLVNMVHLGRGPMRYCANMEPHSHFYCVRCEQVYDVPGEQPALALPPGFRAERVDVAIRGWCRGCNGLSGDA